MSNHQKRLSAPDSWPIERKTAKFTTKAGAGPHGEAGVPLIVLLRDVLEYVDSKKEARYALDQDSVLVNGVPVSDESRPIGMFDILAFTEREEFYRVFPGEGGRLALTPIEADAADSKLGKITGKHDVPGGDTQIALHDGGTLVVEDASEYGGSDSIVIDNEDSEVVAHFPYEEGALVTAVRGGHAGEIGEIEEIQVTPGSSANNVQVSQDGGGFETVAEYVVVIDENFTADDGEESMGADVPAEDDEDDAATDESVGDNGDADAGADDIDEAEDDDADASETDTTDETVDADEADDDETDTDETADEADAEEADDE